MGTDIHGYWEAKKPDGVWVAFKEVPTNRDYLWFGAIAGIRRLTLARQDHHTRGMPDDSSQVWKDYNKFDGLHSHTWLTPSETLDCFELWLNEIATVYPDHPVKNVATKRTNMCAFPELPVKKLMFRYLGYDDNSSHFERAYKEIPWVGVVKGLIGSQSFEKSVRMVVAFDS